MDLEKAIANPVGVLATALLVLVVYVFRDKLPFRNGKDKLQIDEEGFSKAWLERAEQRFKQLHDHSNAIMEVKIIAARGEELAREAIKRLERHESEIEAPLREFYVLKERVDALLKREQEHHEEAREGRKELLEALHVIQNQIVEVIHYVQDGGRVKPA